MSMETSVVIDSCAWDYLFANKVDLSDAFPRDKYTVSITRQIEIEILTIPDEGRDGKDKSALKSYIADSISANSVRTSSVFGFATLDADGTPSKVQVYGGFGHGTWQSETDRNWYASDEVQRLIRNKPIKNSGLSANEADASLAVRAFGSFVLTAEGKTKPGPLRLAAEQGGQVIYIEDIEKSALSIKDYFLSIVKGTAGPRDLAPGHES